MIRKTSLWISWEHHTRSKTLSDEFGATLVEIVIPGAPAKRYFVSTWKTLITLAKYRPQVLFVQNPSIILNLIAVLVRPIFGYELVVDAHNAALEPPGKQFAVIKKIAFYALRRANLVIITNRLLRDRLLAIGAKPFVLPDALPSIEMTDDQRDSTQSATEFTVVAVCSWADDEPVREILRAGTMFPNGVHLQVTGKCPEWAHEEVNNFCAISLTGFVSESEYFEILSKSHCIVDLTTRDDCLVCGAYEALALEKPVILSDNDPGRELFSDYAIFTDNSAEQIVFAVCSVREGHANLQERAVHFKKIYAKKWQKSKNNLFTLLNI